MAWQPAKRAKKSPEKFNTAQSHADERTLRLNENSSPTKRPDTQKDNSDRAEAALEQRQKKEAGLSCSVSQSQLPASKQPTT